MPSSRLPTPIRAVLLVLIALAVLHVGASAQTPVETRRVAILEVEGESFRDLNANGALDPYEDWRRPTAQRVEDLLGRMTLEEKAGMMLINTLNAEAGGRMPAEAVRLIREEKMTRFVFRNDVTPTPDTSGGGGGFGGVEVTPYQAAQYVNAIQELAASTRLGIPVLFKSNARNHYERSARAGINVSSGSFSRWPKEAGLAATRDMELIASFARTMAEEWTAIGLRGMYGYMADLATEPRWYRIHETFTEDADLGARIMRTLVENLQGEELGPKSVALTLKHFPGGGPQEGGGDPHYAFGKNQVYPSGNFDDHVRPFEAAIDAGVSAIMPYYGIPVDQPYQPNDVGMAFSKGIVTDLLRGELGFEGYVNSDTGIIGDRAWGLEEMSVPEQIALAVEAGTDVLSGFDDKDQILDLLASGALSAARVDTAARRLLREQFELGLFEDPYVDPDRAAYVVGNRAFQEDARLAQRKSIVLLQNRTDLLPLPATTDQDTVELYTLGMNPEVVGREEWGPYAVTPGYESPDEEDRRAAVPEGTDYAIIRVEATAESPGQFFGGAHPEELDLLAFSDMAGAETWSISPSLSDIQSVMRAVGPERTILAIYFRQPYVLDGPSGMGEAGGLLATFGVSDAALMDVLTGGFAPTGKLPFALADSPEAIVEQAPDAPGYAEEYTLFPFGHGLTY